LKHHLGEGACTCAGCVAAKRVGWGGVQLLGVIQ
jgi:hypothetical protein